MALTHEPAPELKLQFADPSPASTVLVECALVRVNVLENVGQEYRASFRISHLSTQFLEAEAARGRGQDDFESQVAQSRVAPLEKSPHLASGNDGRLVLRLDDIRKLIGRNTVVEIQYELPPSGLDAPARRLVQTVLQPPVLRSGPGPRPDPLAGELTGRVGGAGTGGRARFGARLGPAQLAVSAPRLKQTSADLERWLVGADGAAAAEDSERASVPSLLCWRGGLEPLTVVHVPQQAWLLLCSLLVLLAGMGTWLFCRQEEGKGTFRFGRVWLVLSLLALGVVTASVFWPTAMAAVAFGIQPGLVVLLLACLVQVLMVERQRRQLVFLPSFTRNRGSSLLRNKPSSARARPHGEPSTVDAPRSS